MIPTSHHSQKQIPSNFKNIKKDNNIQYFLENYTRICLRLQGRKKAYLNKMPKNYKALIKKNNIHFCFSSYQTSLFQTLSPKLAKRGTCPQV